MAQQGVAVNTVMNVGVQWTANLIVSWVIAGSCKKTGFTGVGKEVLLAVAILFTMVDGAADVCIYQA